MSFSLKGKKAVLFDMDGVLYDSMPNHSAAWSQAFKDFGMRMDPEEVYLSEGSTGDYTVSRISLRERGVAATPEEVKAISAHKAEIFLSLPKVEIMAGACELMEKIHKSGLKILIVTGSGQKSLINRALGDFSGFMTRDMMVTAFDVQRGKPFPDPYLKGLEIGGVTAPEAVVVENAPLGIRAAVAAGIETIAVNTGPLENELLEREGSSLLLPSVKALSDIWYTLLG